MQFLTECGTIFIDLYNKGAKFSEFSQFLTTIQFLDPLSKFTSIRKPIRSRLKRTATGSVSKKIGDVY